MPEKLNIAAIAAALVALAGLSACDADSDRRADQGTVAYRVQADAECHDDDHHERDDDDGDDRYERDHDDACSPSQSRPELAAQQAQATPPNNGLFVTP